jgi:hypothetical protein
MVAVEIRPRIRASEAEAETGPPGDAEVTATPPYLRVTVE